MADEPLTLKSITTSPREVKVRLSDLLTKEQLAEHREAVKNEKRIKIKRFDEVDAESAEILARFGFQTWQAWQNGEISIPQMHKYIYAERARESGQMIRWLTTVVASVAGANRPQKGRRTPAGLSVAQQNLEKINRRAKEGAE